MKDKVSIIVCCYNSALKLPKTLEHLSHQKISADLSYEVIIVDNASTDCTADVARLYWSTLNTKIPLRIVHETTAGLVHARICGVHAALYELLVFCDDDNWLREDYVQNAANIMNADASIGVLGGQSVLAPHIKAPNWWKEHQGNYAVGKQLSTTGYANQRGFLYGAGLVTRKSIAKKIFDPQYPLLLTGRKGDQCLSGEDWEYCQRALILGYNLFYSEDLFYWHDVAEHRLNKIKLDQLLQSFEAGRDIAERYKYLRRYFCYSRLLQILLLFKSLANYLLANFNTRYRKLELLKFQTNLCGIVFLNDEELNIIIGWMKKNNQ